MKRWLVSLLLGFYSISGWAFELKVEPVADNVYAIVGEIGPRTPENHGLNNTLGFVVTDEGVVLVGSGASPAGAKLVEHAVASVTDKPIRLLVNIGVQDHHWMGNSYFAGQGVPIKALARTVDSQHQQAEAHIGRLTAQVGDEAKTVVPTYATDIVEADRQTFEFGGVNFELQWPGDGHFVGDAVLWLQQTRTVFTGDFVFLERLLGIHPTTPVAKWQQSFHEIENLAAAHVVPGHGHPADMAKAKAETGDYLDWLITGVSKALEDWQDLGDTVEQMGDAPAFAHLQFFDGWHKRNVHQTYMQLESAR
ncbi:MAG: MBL fold metallo-hydrolase [Candidatus Thiodiazotropha sp. (ex. Lucinisca nassula)]|nr:MBL fold metallo-hydrolase [Candidatus Thiodiazotropha sp. (ex. Lucinisca nassula)]PUB86317.1 MAG: MBL fold metallo-hydrolase [gamma proteobacterium symbiont of Ctena orbiculata]PUB90491.1 MAG: MBL fold metallo-hydrolase [gamma proteobacterium symbiont of Ctena orbiculata]